MFLMMMMMIRYTMKSSKIVKYYENFNKFEENHILSLFYCFFFIFLQGEVQVYLEKKT